MVGFFNLSTRGFTSMVTKVEIAASPVEGMGCPDEASAVAIVTTLAAFCDGFVPTDVVMLLAGTSSLAGDFPTTSFECLGSVETEGLGRDNKR